MNSNELKQEIRQTIYSNRFGDISGNELRDILLEIVNSQNRINGDFEEENIVITNPNGEFVDSGKKLSDILGSAQGATGPQGATGLRGPKGDTGPQGATGPTGENGLTPFIGENSNWWIGTTDTGVKAQGPQGATGAYEGVIYTAGTNINIDTENNVISAIGYVYDNEKDSFSVGTGSATNQNSYAEGSGTIASGFSSHAGGEYSEAQHDKSFAHGDHVVTSNESMAVFGKYSTKLTDWNVRLQVGDGTSAESTRNIFVVQGMTLEGSEGGVHAKGAFKPDAGYINDFAEYFEWADGNPEGEDRIGMLVELKGNKIILSSSIEDCIGAVSATSGFTGGACSLEWHGKYLRDKWGRIQREQIGDAWAPVLNPNYDPNKTYISREKRPEWAPIGLVGQVLVRQDGSLKVGGKAGCKNGVAIDYTSGYRVLQIIDEETAIVLIK